MCKQCLALLVLLLAPAAAMSQRYGRPYTLAESYPLYLEVKAQDKNHYFSPWELQKMPRTTLTLTDPATNTAHVYEGVALERLVPNVAPQGEIIQIDFGSHQTLLLSGTDLDPEAKPLVVDTVDGKPLPGHVPYYLLEKCRGKRLQKITEVRCITVKSSS